MITKDEKRFIKYWEEQRTGGKMKFFLLYIPIYSFIAFIFLSIAYCFLISKRWSLDSNIFMLMIVTPILMSLVTVMSWKRSETKFKSIIKREIREGQEKDKASI